ncbi:MAG: helix-turn-helix domain-containing protein, partial [Actinomycetes bacterium]
RRDGKLVNERLGRQRSTDEFVTGAGYTVEQALAYALSEDAARPAAGLTRREAQIATLIAEGLTNREIGDRLSIARRTTETHVDHILTKLGVSNRTQIATWILRNPVGD